MGAAEGRSSLGCLWCPRAGSCKGAAQVTWRSVISWARGQRLKTPPVRGTRPEQPPAPEQLRFSRGALLIVKTVSFYLRGGACRKA